MNAALGVSRIAISRNTIAAIIRKDLRALWPFALTLAALLLIMSALFRVPSDYPEVMLDFGASQLHLAPVMFLLNAFGLPAVVAIFIVLLVHQDPATDARNDWMVRPISALDLVTAKTLVILAVVMIPSAIGNFAYAMSHPLSVDAATGPIVLTLIGCIFMLVVAWLASSPVQALLAPLVLAAATLLLILSLGLTIGAGVMDTAARRDRTVELAAPADAPRLSILALKREVLEVHSADGTKFVHRFFSPGESYIPRVGSGWTVSTPNGAAFEWRLGGRSLGLFAESGPVDALSVDSVAPAAGSRGPQIALPQAPAPPKAPPAPELPAVEEEAADAPDLPVVEEPEVRAERRQARRLELPQRGSPSGIVSLQDRNERPQRVIDLTWPILIAEFLLMLGAAGVVLWLLLVRRKLLAARMTFLGFFGAATLLMLLQGSVRTPQDEMVLFESIAAPAPVRPAPPEADRMAAFAKHDANDDQKLDKTEYAAVLAELGFSNQLDSLWMQRDDNVDGFITAEEYRAAIPAVPGRTPAPDPQRFAAFTAHDVNKDRKLDRTEYRAVLVDLGFADDFELLWAQRDGNEDGFISAEEYGMPPQ
jgi:hypothetical protein